MNIGAAFPSKYLKAADLQGKRIPVTISRVEMEDFDDGDKPIMYFTGKEKGLVLNKTNSNMMVEITGTEETNDWRGHAAVLYSAKVDFQGKRVDAIRIDHPAHAAAPAQPVPVPAASSQPAGETAFNDDDIPF